MRQLFAPHSDLHSSDISWTNIRCQPRLPRYFLSFSELFLINSYLLALTFRGLWHLQKEGDETDKKYFSITMRMLLWNISTITAVAYVAIDPVSSP
jgi:hypothetical protein